MVRAETIREAVRQAHQWRDVLWRTVMEELEQRNPVAAHAARQATQTQQPYQLVGSATQRALLAWPYLDAQARGDWIWVCEYVQHEWLRGSLAADASDEREQATRGI